MAQGVLDSFEIDLYGAVYRQRGRTASASRLSPNTGAANFARARLSCLGVFGGIGRTDRRLETTFDAGSGMLRLGQASRGCDSGGRRDSIGERHANSVLGPQNDHGASFDCLAWDQLKIIFS